MDQLSLTLDYTSSSRLPNLVDKGLRNLAHGLFLEHIHNYLKYGYVTMNSNKQKIS